MSKNDPVVTLTFKEPISEERYRTEDITPVMLKAIQKRIYADGNVSQYITELVERVIEYLYAGDLERETDEDGNSQAIVVLRRLTGGTRTVRIWTEDVATAETTAKYLYPGENIEYSSWMHQGKKLANVRLAVKGHPSWEEQTLDVLAWVEDGADAGVAAWNELKSSGRYDWRDRGESYRLIAKEWME